MEREPKFEHTLLKCIADDEGWKLIDPQPDKFYLRFFKDDKYIDIFNKSGTLRLRKRTDPTYINKYYRDGDIEKIKEIFKESII